jgi:hypothetical protein
MARRKLGLWLIGVKGGVATTVTVGLAALRKGLAGSQGLVSELPRFAGLDFAQWGDFTIGGHEIRETTLFAEAQQLVKGNHALGGDLVAKLMVISSSTKHEGRHAVQRRFPDRKPGRCDRAEVARIAARRHRAVSDRPPRVRQKQQP